MTRPEPNPVWHPRKTGPILPPSDADLVTSIKLDYYAQFNAEEFSKRISAFEDLDLSDTNVDVLAEVEHALRSGTGPHYILPSAWDEITPGQFLWRARRMTREELLRGGITESDLWEPPASSAGVGRFNQHRDPLLYTCFENPVGALTEARITALGTGFMLVAYEVVEPIRLRRVGVANPDHSLSPEYQLLEEQITRFVAEIISTPADDDGRRTYDFTQRMLEKLYPLETGWETGWIYASTLMPELLNVALTPKMAHVNLAVSRILAGQVLDWPASSDDLNLYLSGYSDGRPAFGDSIGFYEFPHETLHSFEDYLKYIWD